MDSTLIGQLIGYLITAGAIYGSIKGDLKNLHEKIADLKDEAKYQRRRIDDIQHTGETE